MGELAKIRKVKRKKDCQDFLYHQYCVFSDKVISEYQQAQTAITINTAVTVAVLAIIATLIFQFSETTGSDTLRSFFILIICAVVNVINIISFLAIRLHYKNSRLLIEQMLKIERRFGSTFSCDVFSAEDRFPLMIKGTFIAFVLNGILFSAIFIFALIEICY